MDITLADIDGAEAAAWSDMYEAIPPALAERHGIELHRLGSSIAVIARGVPLPLFNRAIGTGALAPATRRKIRDLVAIYRQAAVSRFMLPHVPRSEPCQCGWLSEEGLRPVGHWDRVVRPPGKPFERATAGRWNGTVEKVTAATMSDWSGFLDRMYGLSVASWLEALVGRPGWHHYILRRDRSILAARSMYVAASGVGWLGIDAPIPAVMSDDHQLDQAICARIIAHGLRIGAKGFVADIAAHDPTRLTAPYRYLGRLGFDVTYTRTHYGPVPG